MRINLPESRLKQWHAPVKGMIDGLSVPLMLPQRRTPLPRETEDKSSAHAAGVGAQGAALLLWV